MLFAALCVPVAFWAGWTLFGRRTAWIAALLAAVNPFLTQYAQEGRMYALVTLLGMVSTTCWLQAFTTDARGRVRRAPAIGFAVAFAAMLYTHNWALFFGAATGIAWLVLAVARAAGASGGGCSAPALVAYGGAVLLYLPWLPTALYQAAHTGAPWSRRRRSRRSPRCPARILGEVAEVAVLLAAGAGVVALLRLRDARGRATVALLLIAVLTIVLAWIASQLVARVGEPLPRGRRSRRSCCSPRPASRTPGGSGSSGSRSSRCCGRSTARRSEKSNVRDVATAIAPSLRPGDLVVATQPEQVSVLDYYLPDGLRYATLTGPVARHRRDRLARRRRAAARDLGRARPRAAARLARARPAARAGRAADLRGRPLERAVDRARAAALGGVAAARLERPAPRR